MTFSPGHSARFFAPGVHLDARQDALLRQVVGEHRAVVGLLARGFVEQDHARDEFLDARRGEQQAAVGAAVFLGAGRIDGS